MYKRLFKIVLVHLSIIIYWGFLYKTNRMIKEVSLLNMVSIILLITLYFLIYTEITNKSIPLWISNIHILISIVPIGLILNKTLNYQWIYGLVSILSTILYAVKFMKYKKIKEINILPISRYATNIFGLFFILITTIIIYLFDVDSFMINIFYQLIFLVIEAVFLLYLKEKENTYEKIYRLYYLSDYMANEREEFARIIHDDIIQDIFASRNYLSLKTPDVNHAKDILKDLENRSRDVMKFYQSNLFEDASLEISISALFENVSSLYPDKEIQIERVIDEEIIKMNDEKLIKLISTISKELINNVYKHSKASYLYYNLYKKEDIIIIELESDGANLEDFKRIKESKRGVLLVNLLIDSNSGNILYDLNDDILFTKVILEVVTGENSFIR